MRLPSAPFLQAQRRLHLGALRNSSGSISSRILVIHSASRCRSSVGCTGPPQCAAFATSSSPSAPASSSQVLLQDAVHRAHGKAGNDKHAAFAGTTAAITTPREELLAAIGLEHGQSNAYYNQHLRVALDRKDVRAAALIVSALRAPSSSALPNATIDPLKPVIWTQNYDALLFEWSQRGDVNQVLALLDEMVAFNRVSTRSFNTALVACSKKRKLKQAVHVLQQMREAGKTPGPFAYANAINCCSKGDGNVKMATKFWNEMLHDGVEPSIEVVNCMLRVYNRAGGRSQEAQALVLQAIHAFDLTPDAISQSALVFSLLQDAKTDDVVDFLEEMHEQMQVKVEVDLLNAALDACRQLEDWENAARVQHLMQGSQENSSDGGGNAATKRLVALCEAKDASSPAVAWTFAAPRQLPISARAKQNEMVKKEKQSPEKLRRVFREIITTLENGHEDSEGASSVLRRVENLKQWERIFTSAPIEDVEKFMRLCQKLEANNENNGVLLGVEFYNLYLFALPQHAGRIETALSTLDEMIERQRVDATSFNNVLAMCSRHGRLELAERVLEKMKLAARCAPSTFSYNAILNCCALKRNVPKAEHYYAELKARGLSPDAVTINTMLKTYASMTKKVSQRHHLKLRNEEEGKPEGLSYAHRALKLFQRSSRKLKIEPSKATYFSLFRAFVQEADRIAAFEEDAEEDGDVDDDERIHDQISLLIKRVCVDVPVKNLDVAVFNAAIDYFQRLGDMKSTFDLFNTMKERGFEPNDMTLSLLFAVCSRSEQVDVGLKFLHYLMDEQDYSPTIDVLNGAIQLCASSSSPHDALELFNGIQSSGLLKPTEATFLNLIHAFGRQGDVAQALEYVHAMKQQLGFASLDAYNRVLQACAVDSASFQAMDVLQHMQQHEGLIPNVVSYNMVLKAFAKVRKQAEDDESDDEDDDDERDDEEDDQQSGDFDDDDQNFGAAGEDALDSVKEEEPEFFNVADAETRRAEAESVRNLLAELLDEMQTNGVPPSSITYTRVLAACALRGDTNGVLQFVDELLHRKSNSRNAFNEVVELLSESSLQNYLKACSRARDLDRVMRLMGILQEWHSETGRSVSPRVILQLLNTLEDLGAWRRAVVVLRDVEVTYGVRPNVVFFNRVMEMCNAASEFHFVDQIFSTMRSAAAYRIYPTSQSYIEAIYAAEQREEWVMATNLFLEMQKKCAKDEISATQLQKIALGRALSLFFVEEKSDQFLLRRERCADAVLRAAVAARAVAARAVRPGLVDRLVGRVEVEDEAAEDEHKRRDAEDDVPLARGREDLARDDVADDPRDRRERVGDAHDVRRVVGADVDHVDPVARHGRAAAVEREREQRHGARRVGREAQREEEGRRAEKAKAVHELAHVEHAEAARDEDVAQAAEEQRANVAADVRERRGDAVLAEVDVEHLAEVERDPAEQHVPAVVVAEVRDVDRPRRARGQQHAEVERLVLDCLAALVLAAVAHGVERAVGENEGFLFVRDRGVALRVADAEDQEDEDPDEAQHAEDDEDALPAARFKDRRRHDERRDRAEIAAARDQRHESTALLQRVPRAGDLVHAREEDALAQPHAGAREEEAPRAFRHEHGREVEERPDDDAREQHDLGAELGREVATHDLIGAAIE